ncbi:MAG: HAD-IC family P-type ATPase [Candidatus Dependentiae bacterium]|nr:HAD-IC family P-type ATPase [Candidatus Dependentiae bacterium]
MDFYQVPIDELIARLKTDRQQGLRTEEAKRRLRHDGPNALPGHPPESTFRLFFKQLNNSFSYLLIAAALLKLVIEGYQDAIIIGLVVVVNALVSALQEGRASHILVKLRHFLKSDCLVIRDGKAQTIDQSLLVAGDIILLHAGMKVPADARIFEGQGVRVDEAVLTGESTAVSKTFADLETPNLSASNQGNMLFTGSAVLSGHAHAVVVATGKKALLGQLTCQIDQIETDMPLKRDLAELSQTLIRAVIIIVAVFILIGLLRGKEVTELIFTMTSLLVSIVPEGIPIVSTILMTRNAYRMARTHVLIKRLQAIDGLGRLQVLVVDKTGTLTKNEQVVSTIVIGESQYTVTGDGYEQQGQIFDASGRPILVNPESELGQSARIAALLDDAEVMRDPGSKRLHVRGEPVQAALGICAEKIGFEPRREQRRYPKLDEIAFSSESQVQRVLFDFSADGKNRLCAVMGSPERVLAYAGQQEDAYRAALKRLFDEGLRVIAIGYGTTSATHLGDVAPGTISAISLWGLHDAVRPEAAAGIDAVQELGVRVLVATGDHRQTAVHVARAMGIYHGPESVQEGVAFEKGGQGVMVLARVTPQEKVKIIGHFHQEHLLVGMTGDGVNDVPALVAADVGIAMGTSTDVAKEAADLVLLDDSLMSIARGIMLGRHAFLTMRRVLIFVLATSASEIIAFAIALLINVPLPLLATQILWVHMLTDGLLTIALGMEPMNEKITKVPLAPSTRLVDRSMVQALCLTSLPVAAITLGLFLYALPHGIQQARSIALTALAMGQWWHAWSMRAEQKSIFTQNPFSNIWLLIGTLLVILSQIAALYLPALQNVLHTVPLSAPTFLVCVAASSLVLVINELYKWIHFKIASKEARLSK